MYVCPPWACLGQKKMSGPWELIPRNCNFRQLWDTMWYWDSNLDLLEEQPVLVTSEPSLQPWAPFYILITICKCSLTQNLSLHTFENGVARLWLICGSSPTSPDASPQSNKHLSLACGFPCAFLVLLSHEWELVFDMALFLLWSVDLLS